MLLYYVSTVLASVFAVCQTGAYAQIGSFRKPLAKVRPRFRYWLPDASVDSNIVVADIESAARIGAGGVEFLPFYNYGYPPPPGSDWSKYGFGTPAFLKIFKDVLLAHQRHNLSMDFALDPNQGQGVPAESTDEGLQWDLVRRHEINVNELYSVMLKTQQVPFSFSVPANGSYSGVLPGWGIGELVGLVQGTVQSRQNKSRSLPGVYGPNNASWTRITLREASLVDLTSNVLGDGRVNINTTKGNDTSQLFAFYQKQTLTKNLYWSSNDTSTIFDNGSYIVDHFSSRGAQRTIDFWEKYILVDGIDELLQSLGNYGWEDSIESPSNISWSPSLPQRFQQTFNYTITKYLPLIMFENNNIGLQPTAPGAIQCVLENEDLMASVQDDYRQALLDGYHDYVTTLKSWLNTSLNLSLSSQPAYNLPIDMLASIPDIDAPECESLGFKDSIDAYRQFAGPAHLAGKDVISNELGAVFFKAYQYTIPDLLFAFDWAVVGGVNQVVLHGQQYSGNYAATTWPGAHTFNYIVSEMYSQKQPAWDHGYAEMLEYMARVQFIHRKGVPRVDIAVLDKRSATDPNFPRIYQPSDLEDGSRSYSVIYHFYTTDTHSGWTYNYISTDNLDLAQSVVRDRVLGPDGPAFKALVIESHQNLSIAAVEKLQSLADAGLPLIFSGGEPGYFDTKAEDAESTFKENLQKLLRSSNSFSTVTGEVASQLNDLGLTPMVTMKTNGTWYNTFRDDKDTGSAFVFVLNDSPLTTGEIVVAGIFSPYLLDPMTGDQWPMINFSRDNSTTTIPLTLAANQTVLLELRKDSDCESRPHFASLPSSIIGHHVNGSSVVLQVSASDDQEDALLSNGTTISLTSSGGVTVPPPFSLTGWNLTVEHWEAPANIWDANITAEKHNTSHVVNTLTSWARIEALQNVSGVGYYSTTFDWHADSQLGAYIDLTQILHSVRVYVNDDLVPALDYRRAKRDVTSYLKDGNNDIVFVVPSTMWNYILSISSAIVNGGAAMFVQDIINARSDNGLVGDVRIIPFREHVVAV